MSRARQVFRRPGKSRVENLREADDERELPQGSHRACQDWRRHDWSRRLRARWRWGWFGASGVDSARAHSSVAMNEGLRSAGQVWRGPRNSMSAASMRRHACACSMSLARSKAAAFCAAAAMACGPCDSAKLARVGLNLGCLHRHRSSPLLLGYEVATQPARAGSDARTLLLRSAARRCRGPCARCQAPRRWCGRRDSNPHGVAPSGF